jgi:hypothetical protein
MARDADDGRGARRQVSETRRDAGDTEDARRMAHNPEVAGSNPAPRYQVKRPPEHRSGGRFHARGNQSGNQWPGIGRHPPHSKTSLDQG